MKKKITAIALVVCLVAVAIVGGSLAYFTDTDDATNTFTVGNVAIDLIEQERGENGLQDFTQDKVLMPIVGSAQGEKETVDGVEGLPTAKNYVDKILTIENTGKSDAYVRLYIAIPAALDNVNDAGQNVLHYNISKASLAEGQWADEELVAEDVTIGSVAYNVYSRTYTSILSKDVVTGTPAYIGFYLDKDVDFDGTDYTLNGTAIDFDFSNGVSIPVFAVGVQADGFTSADAAIDAAFGANYNPWPTT